MIPNDEALEVVREQLALAEHALESLRRDILPKTKRNFEVLSEGPIDQIAELKAEIEAYENTKKNSKGGKIKSRKAS